MRGFRKWTAYSLVGLAVTLAACDRPGSSRSSGKLARWTIAADPKGGVWRVDRQTGDLQNCIAGADNIITCRDAPMPTAGTIRPNAPLR